MRRRAKRLLMQVRVAVIFLGARSARRRICIDLDQGIAAPATA
jgi:hypothetical protein